MLGGLKVKQLEDTDNYSNALQLSGILQCRLLAYLQHFSYLFDVMILFSTIINILILVLIYLMVVFLNF